jgi:hypothetical protein
VEFTPVMTRGPFVPTMMPRSAKVWARGRRKGRGSHGRMHEC